MQEGIHAAVQLAIARATSAAGPIAHVVVASLSTSVPPEQGILNDMPLAPQDIIMELQESIGEPVSSGGDPLAEQKQYAAAAIRDMRNIETSISNTPAVAPILEAIADEKAARIAELKKSIGVQP